MNIKKNIKKIGIIALWIVLTSGVLVLFVAAIEKKDRKNCKNVEIDIKGVEEHYFLDSQDILNIIGVTKTNKLEGRPLLSFNLQGLENTLEKNVWVKDAELFFDNNLVLHIKIEEREPVARIFTVMNNSFYIDSSGKKLPLSDKMNVRLPVFTNFTAEKTTGLNKADRRLVEDMKKLSLFMLKDKFWMAQIAQIDIVAGNNFEMVPTIGNHIIEFGNGDNLEKKFNRLFIFYKDVAAKTGFDKYNRLDVRYDKQVIGTKRGSITKVDSVQAMNNIQKLIMAGMRPPVDSSNQINENN